MIAWNYWFFIMDEIPDGKLLAVNENGEPVLVDAK